MTRMEQEKLHEIVKQLKWLLEYAKKSYNIHTTPYEEGGRKHGQDISIEDKGWIEGKGDAVTAWETAIGLILDSFPEIFSNRKEVKSCQDQKVLK